MPGNSTNTLLMAIATPLEWVERTRQKLMIWKRMMQRMDFCRPNQ